jgi:multidrug efflux pump subunit AcrA (membrane-fusion protein)
LEVRAEIDEIDVADVLINQQALIKLEALPATTYAGTVTSVSIVPKVNPQNSGVVVYEVKVSFNNVPSIQVKSGMSAVVDIATHEKNDVLLIPNTSIKQNIQGQTVVGLVIDQKVVERQVKTGLTDGIQTEVVDGLQRGDIIIK